MISIMVLGIISPNLHLLQTNINVISDSPKDIALKFLMNSPTYKFDGLLLGFFDFGRWLGSDNRLLSIMVQE